MGFLQNMSAAAGSVLQGGLGLLGNLGGSIASTLFNANQAKINRQFQERMYDKQVADNIKFWQMTNEYNDPSAALERLRNAGLSPMFMFSDGSTANIAQQPNSGTAPHGAQAQSNINSRIDLANLALVEAQADLTKAEAERTRNESAESRNRNISIVLQNEITERTKDAVVALADKNVDKMQQEIDWIATQDNCLVNMTAKSLENLSDIIEYRKKYYDIDNTRLAYDAWYQIESIAIGKAHVSNELKQVAVNMYNAKTGRMRVIGELEVFAAQVEEINSRTDLNESQKSNMILDSYNKVLKNSMIENIGTDNLGSAAGLLLLLTGSVTGRIKD